MTGATVWYTGLPAAGKTTAANILAESTPRRFVVLDGDELRAGLNHDLDFSFEGRAEAVRRAGEVALIVARSGLVAVVAMVSPYRACRESVRSRHLALGIDFVEVFVDTPLDQCRARDPKGLYAKSRAGSLPGLTGVDAPYEEPLAPDVHLTPDVEPSTATAIVLSRLAWAS
jgi:bifunctional enzyme CysN/CysC